MIEILLLLGAGFLVGIMNAIAGGGVLLAFPVLLSTGLSPLVANVSASVAVLPGLLSSSFGYRSYIKRIYRPYLLLLIPCLIGSIVGALLLIRTPSSNFDALVPWLVLFAVTLFAFQPYLHRKVAVQNAKKKHRSAVKPLILLSLAVIPLAIYGGYFGAGFGFIMLAFLGFSGMHNIHKMNGLKNLASAVIAITTIAVVIPSDLINWRVAGIMAIGSLVGGFVGTRIAVRVPSQLLRFVVIGIGVSTVVYLFVNSLTS